MNNQVFNYYATKNYYAAKNFSAAVAIETPDVHKWLNIVEQFKDKNTYEKNRVLAQAYFLLENAEKADEAKILDALKTYANTVKVNAQTGMIDGEVETDPKTGLTRQERYFYKIVYPEAAGSDDVSLPQVEPYLRFKNYSKILDTVDNQKILCKCIYDGFKTAEASFWRPGSDEIVYTLREFCRKCLEEDWDTYSNKLQDFLKDEGITHLQTMYDWDMFVKFCPDLLFIKKAYEHLAGQYYKVRNENLDKVDSFIVLGGIWCDAVKNK
ncbi:MAG: hypothetical protein MJZ34_02770 [Paludibacteraceae bacterium]|nr:hypothetical protein [Paludibacteraceae bacterium]